MGVLIVNRGRVELELARRGWTQAKLADLVGVSRQAVHQWLHGRYDAHRLAAAVATAFGLPIEEILRVPDDDGGAQEKRPALCHQ